MDPTLAVDRILETGNLTDNLRDTEANWLIEWGVQHVRALVEPIADEEAGWEVVSQLMGLMRELNRLAATATTGNIERLTDDVKHFLGHYAAVFATPDHSQSADVAELVASLQAAAPIDCLQRVVNFAAAQGATVQRPGTSSGNTPPAEEPPAQAAQDALREGYAPDYLGDDHPIDPSSMSPSQK